MLKTLWLRFNKKFTTAPEVMHTDKKEINDGIKKKLNLAIFVIETKNNSNKMVVYSAKIFL